jgi:hypothetical protein
MRIAVNRRRLVQLDGAVRMLSIKIETLIMNTQIRKPASAPAQGHPDVSRHSARKINDLNPQLVAAIAEMPLPEGIDLLQGGIFTLKNRSLSPIAELVIDCAREGAKSVAKHK